MRGLHERYPSPLRFNDSLEEAQEFATQWLWTYNNERPNMGIGGITPAQKLKMAA
jgi:putative transposase